MPQNTPSNTLQEEKDPREDRNMWVQELGHLSAKSHVYCLFVKSPQSGPKRDEPHTPQL